MILKIKHFIVALIGGLAVGAVVQASVMPWTIKAMRVQASTSTVTEVVTPTVVTNDFTIRFLTGTFPTNLILGLTPSVTNLAQYDAGDGIWRGFTSRTITLATASSYISFRGSWTNSARTYQALFSETFNTNTYTCQTEGAFSNKPAMANAYREMFQNAKAIVSFTTNPIPILTGTPGVAMYNRSFDGMSGLTRLPDGFMDTRGLSGPPSGSMCYLACRNMSNVTNLPVGFMDFSGLSGPPASLMIASACNGMSSLVSGYCNLSSNITFASTNVASPLSFAFANMPKWTGTVYWGTNRIYDVISNPATDANTFQNSTLVPGYTNMLSNWK
jgi:hypothetical protein